MFNLSAVEVLVILVVALVVLGPERLPGAARKIGQMMGQVRDLSANFQREVHNAMTIPDVDTEKPHTRPHLTAIDGGRHQDDAGQADENAGTADDEPEVPVNEPIGAASVEATVNGETTAPADTDSTASGGPAAALTND